MELFPLLQKWENNVEVGQKRPQTKSEWCDSSAVFLSAPNFDQNEQGMVEEKVALLQRNDYIWN